jgi:predicted GNAT family N-acyltransferase
MAFLETDSANFEVCDSDWIPGSAISLIWQVFFSSRNRGVSPEFHFPWIHDQSGLTCVRVVTRVDQTQATVAALVLRHRRLATGKKVGLIGLVCVAENFRGMGLSTRLIKQAIELARSQELAHLVLWTTKPDVYRYLGFGVDSTDVFGPVKRRLSTPSGAGRVNKTEALQVDLIQLAGAPAFANQVVRYSSANGATLSVCKSDRTETLVEYSGPLSSVVDLIGQVMPDTWTLNVLDHDPLIDLLNRSGYETALKPSSVRMTLPLANDEGLTAAIPFLERI